MITNFFQLIQPLLIPLDFLCHIIIFIGGFYIAMHSRCIPRWLVTCIWYIGLSSFLNAVTILLQWTYGDAFPMSYSNVGIVTEIMLNVNLAVTVVLMFANTVREDIMGSKNRK
jgi:hypothetical protein